MAVMGVRGEGAVVPAVGTVAVWARMMAEKSQGLSHHTSNHKRYLRPPPSSLLTRLAYAQTPNHPIPHAKNGNRLGKDLVVDETAGLVIVANGKNAPFLHSSLTRSFGLGPACHSGQRILPRVPSSAVGLALVHGTSANLLQWTEKHLRDWLAGHGSSAVPTELAWAVPPADE